MELSKNQLSVASNGHKLISINVLEALHLDKNEVDFFFCTDTGRKVIQKLKEAEKYYYKWLKKLKYFQSHLPTVISELEKIQALVDKRHRNCLKAKIGGSTASFAGGAMFITGIILAPFTFGLSIAFSAVGGVLTIGGTYITTIAQVSDKYCGSSDSKKSKMKLDTFLEHKAKFDKYYQKMMEVFVEIADILFKCQKMSLTFSQRKRTPLESFKTLVIQTVSNSVMKLKKIRIPNAVSIPIKCVLCIKTIASNTVKLVKAVGAPSEIHLASKLALQPHKFINDGAFCGNQIVNTLACGIEGELDMFCSSVVCSGQAVAQTLSRVSIILTAIGMAVDGATIAYASYQLRYDKKSTHSKEISSHIEELKGLQSKLDPELHKIYYSSHNDYMILDAQ